MIARDACPYQYPSDEVSQHPYPFYAFLREEAPVHRLPSGEYVVSRWDDVVAAIMDPERFSNAIGPVNRGHPGGDGLVGGTVVGAGEDGSSPYEPWALPFTDPPVQVMIDVFGIDEEEARRGATGDGDFQQADWERTRHPDVRKHGADFFRAIVLDRHERPREGDFVSELVRSQVDRDGRLELPYLTAELTTMFFAGQDTTEAALLSTMLLILTHPDALERVRADRSLVRPMFEEALRLETPVQALQRVATQDTELGGVPIPAGATVLLSYAAANRDPSRFGRSSTCAGSTCGS